MKLTFISFLTVIFVIAGCSLFKNTMHSDKMQIINAGYHNWSEPPLKGDVPEKGTDLALIVANWPKGATPDYIVYEKWKSFTPNVSDTSDIGVLLNAHIIKASSVLNRASEQVNLSDRLVYTLANGKTKSVEIKDWTRIDSSKLEK